MKKGILLMLVLALCFGLCACGSSNVESDSTTNKQDDVAQEYVGEWKSNVLESFMNGVKTYKVAIIMLNADGTATYRGKDATWEYKENTIQLAVTGAGVAVFEIAEDGGKTVLKFYEDTYYRASEFVESN